MCGKTSSRDASWPSVKVPPSNGIPSPCAPTTLPHRRKVQSVARTLARRLRASYWARGPGSLRVAKWNQDCETALLTSGDGLSYTAIPTSSPPPVCCILPSFRHQGDPRMKMGSYVRGMGNYFLTHKLCTTHTCTQIRNVSTTEMRYSGDSSSSAVVRRRPAVTWQHERQSFHSRRVYGP